MFAKCWLELNVGDILDQEARKRRDMNDANMRLRFNIDGGFRRLWRDRESSKMTAMKMSELN